MFGPSSPELSKRTWNRPGRVVVLTELLDFRLKWIPSVIRTMEGLIPGQATRVNRGSAAYPRTPSSDGHKTMIP